jgi:hypothetical protein
MFDLFRWRVDDEGDAKCVSIQIEKGERKFSFDNVFLPSCTEDEIYTRLKPLVTSTMDGFNSTIFTFGATGSGKTHTMCGTAEGIIFRAIQDVFDSVEEKRGKRRGSVLCVEISLVELYNNQFRSLLRAPDGGGNAAFNRANNLASDLNSAADHSDSSMLPFPSFASRSSVMGEKIELHESPEVGVFLVGHAPIRVPVASAHEAIALVSRGLDFKKTGPTSFNTTSSKYIFITFTD